LHDEMGQDWLVIANQAQMSLSRLTDMPGTAARLADIAEDRTSKEIAEILGCSHRTVESHRQRISQKLDLSGSHSLLRFAFDHKADL